MSADAKDILEAAIADVDAETRASARGQIADEIALLNIALAVRDARLALGLSQQELADRCGITQTQVSRIEKSLFEPRLQTLLALSGALGIQFLIGKASGRGKRKMAKDAGVAMVTS